MNKTERDELRRLIRARFKVLRSDVELRKAELLAELEAEIAARFADEDKRWRDAAFVIDKIRREANGQINDVYRELIGKDEYGTATDHNLVSIRHIAQPHNNRGHMRNQGAHQIEARCKAALLELDRREVELLSDLATSALESAEARQFMQQIPTVTELVPAYRLREIEGSL